MTGRAVALVAIVGLVALTACSASANGPSAPGQRLLVDRIDALEADIAQLYAEMQELRVEYVPIEEMSEDEFTRHVEKRLAKVPAEQRPSLEKELRSKRKAATLEGKALADYWDDRFANEGADPEWATTAEQTCRPRLQTAVGERGKVTSFECRKERCRVDIQMASDGPAVDAAVRACVAEPTDADQFADAVETSRIIGESGRVRVTLFVVRKGHSMKVE